jgi:hypothetical protein
MSKILNFRGESMPPEQEKNQEQEQNAQQPSGVTVAGDKREESAPKPKSILITLNANGGVEVDCVSVTPADFYGMMHEADRAITKQIEFDEMRAMQEQIRRDQELRMIQSAMANQSAGKNGKLVRP